jgi:hypothetical protein
MKLSKIDVAEVQIRAAVRMFFEGQHPVPIFTLANAAREIVASVGEQTDVRTVQRAAVISSSWVGHGTPRAKMPRGSHRVVSAGFGKGWRLLQRRVEM